MHNAETDRFEFTYKQDSFGTLLRILKDTKTGMSYIYTGISGYGGGLTPLLDSDGKPLRF